MGRLLRFGFAIVSGSLGLSQAVAAPSATLRPQGEALALQHVQYQWRGQEYCWYEHGWHGAGWYRCGYAGRRGVGWGGPAGWHRWSHLSRRDSAIRRHGSGADFQQPPVPGGLGGVGSTTTNSPLLRSGGVSTGTGSGVAPLSGATSGSGSLSSGGARTTTGTSNRSLGSSSPVTSGSSGSLSGGSSSTGGTGSSTGGAGGM